MGSDESHFNINCEGQSHKTVSTNHLFEEKGEPKGNRAEALLLTSLTARPKRLTLEVGLSTPLT